MEQPPVAQHFGVASIINGQLHTSSGVYPLASASSAQMITLPSSNDGVSLFAVGLGIVVIILSLATQSSDRSQTASTLGIAFGAALIALGVFVGKARRHAVLITMAGGEQLNIQFPDQTQCRVFLTALASAMANTRDKNVHVDARQIHVHNPPPNQIK